jgi:hypothetical protein
MSTLSLCTAALALGLLCLPALAADSRPAVPRKPLATKGKLLFSDDFSKPSLEQPWHRVVATFGLENGALKGTQTRVKDETASDGKIIKAHAAVHGLEIPTRDSIVECRIRFEGATMIDVEFDDRKYTGAHYGHLCRAQVRPNGVTIIDEKEGSMRNDIYTMRKDPARKAEADKLVKGRQITYPLKVEAGIWHDLIVETVGDAMRVVLDGKPVAFLKSPGIAHPTKSKIELGVAGQHGFFDDIRVYEALPKQP